MLTFSQDHYENDGFFFIQFVNCKCFSYNHSVFIYLIDKLFFIMYSSCCFDPKNAYPKKNACVTLPKPSSMLATSSKSLNNLCACASDEFENQYCQPSVPESANDLLFLDFLLKLSKSLKAF